MFNYLVNFYSAFLSVMDSPDIILSFCFFLTVFVLLKNIRFQAYSFFFKRRLEIIKEMVVLEKELMNYISLYEKTLVILNSRQLNTIALLKLCRTLSLVPSNTYSNAFINLESYKIIMYTLQNVYYEIGQEMNRLNKNKGLLMLLKFFVLNAINNQFFEDDFDNNEN